MGDKVISAPSISVNDSPVAIVPNSFSYTEGKGEQTVRVVSTGGGAVEQVYSQNVESNLSNVKFTMLPTLANIDLARQWKTNENQNVLVVTGKDGNGNTFDRTFQNAGLINDTEIQLGSETVIELEFLSDAAV